MKGFMSLGYFERRVKKVLTFITPEGSRVLQASRKIKEALFHSKKTQSDISLWIFCIKKLVVLVLFWKEG